MFKKPDAISRAPICNGIRRLENVPDNPPVSTKNTMMVPWMVTSAKYAFRSKTPPGAHFPKNVSKMEKLSPGHPNCKRKKTDNKTATTPITIAVTKNCLEIIL